MIKKNKYFDKYYFYIYLALTVPLFVAASIIIINFSIPDSHEARKMLLMALWNAFIADVLIGTWILIYILALYPYPEVYSLKFMSFSNSDGDYETESKGLYIFYYSVLPWFNAV